MFYRSSQSFQINMGAYIIQSRWYCTMKWPLQHKSQNYSERWPVRLPFLKCLLEFKKFGRKPYWCHFRYTFRIDFQWPEFCSRAVPRRGSSPFARWDRGFESLSNDRCVCVVLSCVGRDLATGYFMKLAEKLSKKPGKASKSGPVRQSNQQFCTDLLFEVTAGIGLKMNWRMDERSSRWSHTSLCPFLLLFALPKELLNASFLSNEDPVPISRYLIIQFILNWNYIRYVHISNLGRILTKGISWFSWVTLVERRGTMNWVLSSSFIPLGNQMVPRLLWPKDLSEPATGCCTGSDESRFVL